jgi:membrane fusion protein (multidrug efflux system)
MADSPGIFRQEAVEALERPHADGALLDLAPRWINWSYRAVVVTVAAGVLFALLAPVGDYARGPAVVRVDGRLDLATVTGGLVMDVDVRSGQQVRAGQTLVRLHTAHEQQELAHLDREFELRLVRVLLHPEDRETRASLASLRAARELAAARLRERQVIAPRAGVVRNLRIRPGQQLAPGDVVLTLADESRAGFSVVALVPGQFRPMLRPGLPLRFALEGYPQVAAPLQIEAVGDEAVGPAEIRRFFGRELADTLPIASEGSLVLVRARLPEPTFLLEGQRYRYYDGVPGRVDVRVRTMRLGAMLLPALEGVFGRGL